MIMSKTIEALDIGGKIYLSVNSIVLLIGIITIVGVFTLVSEVKKLRKLQERKYLEKDTTN